MEDLKNIAFKNLYQLDIHLLKPIDLEYITSFKKCLIRIYSNKKDLVQYSNSDSVYLYQSLINLNLNGYLCNKQFNKSQINLKLFLIH